MTQPRFKRCDFSNARRLFVVGDIHGCFDILEEKLDAVAFDGEQDALVLLGDLVDRGDFNEAAIDWIDRPGITRVLGNHEFLLAAAVRFGEFGVLQHTRNGGEWFAAIRDPEERALWADKMMDCPVAIEATTPAGRRVGFVHANVPTDSWDELEAALAQSPDPASMQGTIWDCMWQRDRIQHLKMSRRFGGNDNDVDFSVSGIDHVFFGHTPVKEPLNHRNCSWIDTGAFMTSKLALVEVDQWITDLNP